MQLMKKTFFGFILIILTATGFSQKLILTAKPNVSLNGSSNGYYEAVPDNMDKNKALPLFIFLHGQGEIGNGVSDLPKVLNNAPMTYIKNGVLNIQAIFLAPQIKDGAPYSYVITQTIDKAVALGYPIDRTRVYGLALSMGSVALWDLARNMAIKKIAAIVPVSGAWDQGSSPIATASIYRDEKLPVWAFHNQGDPTVSVNIPNTWIAAISSPTAKKTIFPGGGHDAWTKAFDPAFKENGLNVYEWAMQYTTTRGQVVSPVQPAPVFKSAAIKGTFTRNNCGEGSTGTAIDYTVPAARFTGATQAEADKLAAAALAKEGQEFANANATCTAKRVLMQVIKVYSDGSIEIEPQ